MAQTTLSYPGKAIGVEATRHLVRVSGSWLAAEVRGSAQPNCCQSRLEESKILSPGKPFSAVFTLKCHLVPIELPPEECTLISVAAAIVHSCHKFPPGRVWLIGDGIIFGSQTDWKRSVCLQPEGSASGGEKLSC